MRTQIDINCDLGEHETLDAQFLRTILPRISSANISCGAHAGNDEVIKGTIALARDYKCSIGAHPSYPDRENFGRKSMELDQQSFNQMLHSQLVSFKELCASENVYMQHVKPHGALYNDLAQSEMYSNWFIEFINLFDANIKIYGLAHSVFHELAIQHNLNFISEGFMDRRYTKNLKLKARSESDAVINDKTELIVQLDNILNGYVVVDDTKINIQVDSLCLHGDTPGADDLLRHVFNHLNKKGIEITSA
ncbi:MAG: lactam utilization protein LamB [Saprospiraceae bacterium]|nr:lactam utilization protein LamB [Saprospiraceae bacterium]